MNGRREKPISSSCCNIHPEEILVGVCPLCLNERLMLLSASQQKRKRPPPPPSKSAIDYNLQESKSFNKKKHRRFFSFGSSFFGFLFESQHHRHNHDAVLSPDDSFISIKFEENGAPSWDKGKVPTISLKHCKGSAWEETKKEMMIQHPSKSRVSLTWHKRIGQIIHIIRLKRLSACHVSSKVEVVDVRSRWIRHSTTKKAPN
ncbi:PREDICTED: uncharacterized protein LOC104806821 [Tarenaya hassleriana]|uniref:uncharacterized protein LOC104806821 n=1 Tax=Tarenaya hassleriana TaxID=28532 RepID=UPI00053C5FC6|nr:PREDICTED: uncharacterized protein LOC104806821 [Tarenaya hassleriana]